MKLFQTLVIFVLTTYTGSRGFSPLPAITNTRIAPLNVYVPDGLTEADYEKIKQADKEKLGKDVGRLGTRGFKSRSLKGWQEALDRGEVEHQMAPLGYQKQLKDGTIHKRDVPYMVRQGGSWDNSDVVGAHRVPWHATDTAYAKGGYKKELSASILGSGPGFNWTGTCRSQEDNTKSRIPGMS
jgi:hypothetical protein